MTKKELLIKAKELGLKGYSKLNKAELEILIEATEYKLHDSEALFTGECSGDGEWLNHRLMGATDVASLVIDSAWRNGAINKQDNYSSPYLMYLEKKGKYIKEFLPEQKITMNFGHYCEDFIISNLKYLFQKEYNIEIEDVKKGNQVVFNKEYPLWTCTPDSFVKINGEWYPVELKTGNSYQKYDWEKESVPDKYYAQVQQQLAVLGKSKGYLIGFIDNRFTRIYEIELDKKLINYAYELSENFNNCLINNIEPELNGCKLECEYLKQEFKGFEKNYDKIPGIEIKNLDTFKSLKSTTEELKKELKELETDINPFVVTIQNKMLELETSELLVNNKMLATWKIGKTGRKTFSIKELKEAI